MKITLNRLALIAIIGLYIISNKTVPDTQKLIALNAPYSGICTIKRNQETHVQNCTIEPNNTATIYQR